MKHNIKGRVITCDGCNEALGRDDSQAIVFFSQEEEELEIEECGWEVLDAKHFCGGCFQKLNKNKI